MDTQNRCATCQGLSLKNGVDIWTYAEKCKICVVASNCLIVV